MAAVRTLDIPDLQIIREYPDDAGGFFWHHRVALQRLAPGRWVMLTPDHDLEVVDMNEVQYRLLHRAAAFPAAQAPFVYAFDPLPRAELTRLKRQARAFRALLGDGGDEEMVAPVWVVCDTRDSRFGQRIPDDVAGDDELIVEIGDKAIILWEEEHRFCERVVPADMDATVRTWRAADGDSRILRMVRDPAGKRMRTLRDTVGAFTEEAMTDWPHIGPRALKELWNAVSSAVDSWVLYHSEWERNSGVSSGISLCHEHRMICEFFRLSHTTDQINCPNLAGAELMARRLIQIEMAVERSPRAPDFSGLSTILAGPTSESGAAVTKDFTEWVAGRQRDRAAIMKQTRLLREETAAEKKRQQERGQRPRVDDGGKGAGKKGKKGKDGAADAGGAAPAGGEG